MTDEQLAEMAAAGDQDAFTGIYERYKRALFNFSWRLLGEAGLAEDAAQEALISVLRHIQHFDAAKGSFRTWIFTIARNECRHSLKMRRWWSFGEKSEDGHLFDKATATDSRPSLEGRLDIEKALRRLPTKYLLPPVLCKLHGLSTRECAEMLKLSEVNVKQRVFRAVHQLHEIMSPGNKRNRV